MTVPANYGTEYTLHLQRVIAGLGFPLLQNTEDTIQQQQSI